jgi:hypothetical protein
VNLRIIELQQLIAKLSAELSAMLMVPEAPAQATTAEWRSIDGFAERWNVSAKTIRRMIAEGLPHDRVRKRLIRIPVRRADAWIVEAAARAAAERATSLDEAGGGMHYDAP